MDDYDKLAAPRRRSWLGPLILMLLAFAAGIAAMVAVAQRWQPARTFLVGAEAPTPQTMVVRPQVAAVPQSLQAVPQQQAATDRRVAELEQRISIIDERAQAASGNADRAEGLLVAIAARRAIDRGLPLGYIESLLRERFGGTQPQAVATIIAAARQPVLIEDLRAGLVSAGPTLIGGGLNGGSWWDGVKRELAGLIVVRRASEQAAQPGDRLARALRQIEDGRVEVALAEVARMPGRDRAADWIALARRYAAAREALDMIETAALLQPRNARPSVVTPAVAPAPALETEPAAPADAEAAGAI